MIFNVLRRLLGNLGGISVKSILEQPAFIGYVGIVVMVSALIVWGVAAPLTEAIVTSGTVNVSAQRRTVSHINGGKIKELFVAEGDSVRPGQALLVLDTQELEAQLDVLRFQHFARQAAVDRLIAERNDASALTFRPSLLEQTLARPRMAEFLEGEKRNFEARQHSYAAKRALLEEPAKKAAEQRERLSKQLNSIDRQLAIVRQQTASATDLYNKGYGTKSKAMAFERETEQLVANRIEVDASLGQLEGVIDDSKRQRALHRAEFRDEIESAVLTAEREIAEIVGKILALEKQMENQIIRSSVHGIIVDLRSLTANDVITPATPIADIIPTDSSFIIEAHLQPNEIEGVVKGLDVEVRFPALAAADLHGISGTLSFVSADVVTDPNSPEAYYRIHVAIDDWSAIDESTEIVPGMPADIVIKKRERTLFQYLLAPITDHATRAFAA